jgi:hypothetical protein
MREALSLKHNQEADNTYSKSSQTSQTHHRRNSAPPLPSNNNNDQHKAEFDLSKVYINRPMLLHMRRIIFNFNLDPQGRMATQESLQSSRLRKVF